MNKPEQIQDLAEQIERASLAGDLAEVNRLTSQLDQLQKPQSFAEAWGYPGGEARQKDNNSFTDAWSYGPGERG